MGVFVSYSSRDSELLDQLMTALERAKIDVWRDEQQAGTEQWWRKILEQVRDCDVFVVAMSQNFLQSKVCRAELQYAQTLGKPVLPVQIGPVESMRVNPLAAMQAIDFRNPTTETGIELVSNVYAQQQKPHPLPDPLPDDPPMPFAYLAELDSTITAPQLTPHDQVMVVSRLKAALDEDGDEEIARRGIAQLANTLRELSDITYRTRNEVDSLLATLEPAQQPPTHTPAQQPSAYETQPSYQPRYFGQTSPARPQSSSRTWLFVGAGAVAAVILVVVIVVVVVINRPEPVPAPAPLLSDSAVGSLLLTTDEVNSIMGTTNLTARDVVTKLDPTPPEISNTKCSGAFNNVLQSVYEGSGYSTVSTQTMSAKDPQVWVNQAAVAFPTADQATRLFNTSADNWKACAGQTLTIKIDTETHWTFGDLSKGNTQIAQTATQDSTTPWACQHVMHVVSNVIIEANACHVQIADQARTIADKMAAKVPK